MEKPIRVLGLETAAVDALRLAVHAGLADLERNVVAMLTPSSGREFYARVLVKLALRPFCPKLKGEATQALVHRVRAMCPKDALEDLEEYNKQLYTDTVRKWHQEVDVNDFIDHRVGEWSWPDPTPRTRA